MVKQGLLCEARIDESVRRILAVKFDLGLFDQPYVDEMVAQQIVAAPEFVAEGHRAQARSITVLKNDGVLPLRAGTRVYLDGLDEATAHEYGAEVVSDPSVADIAILRIAAAYEPRNTYFLEATTHQGSLDYPQDVVEQVASLAHAVPVLLDVYLDRAAILTPLEPYAAGIVANYGASHRALLDALFNRVTPEGRLPIELPSSMDEVRASHPDVGSDTANPLFPVGTGLKYLDA